MTSAISVSNLSKTYASGFRALQNINLDIRHGEIFALLGPNGAGKTTLINIICGIVKPSAGTVTVDGHDIIADYRAARAMIGLVPQELTTDAFETPWATLRFSGSATHPEEVELALWFHDAIYDLGHASNERRSAQFARARLGALGVRPEAVERIAACIEATARHESSGGDAALVVDLDLTVLGAGRREFDAFERRIRLEYAHVPESIYREARRRVLEGFLSRAQIYEIAPLRAELEPTARANLARRIRELSDASEGGRETPRLTCTSTCRSPCTRCRAGST